MNVFAKTAFSNALGDKFARLGGDNPLFRTGLYAVGVRLAMRSFPVTLAILGAGAALRYLTKNKQDKRTGSAPARAKRARTTKIAGAEKTSNKTAVSPEDKTA